jgi:hypothetical protein
VSPLGFLVQAQGGIHYKLFLKMPPYSVLVCCLQTRVTKLGEMLSFWLLFTGLGNFFLWKTWFVVGVLRVQKGVRAEVLT